MPKLLPSRTFLLWLVAVWTWTNRFFTYASTNTTGFHQNCNDQQVSSAGPTETCSMPNVSSMPFCDTSLTVWERAEDLVQRLTLEEKIPQLQDQAPAIPRLFIDRYNWWTESLHGILSLCHDGPTVKRCPTIYPAPLNGAATFNKKLVRTMASQISTEGRRMYAEGSHGLDFWAPNINIFRDPRWGRGQETPGEDPYLSGEYAVAYVQGLQEGEDPRYLKAIATLKHYAGYSLEKWHQYERHSFNATISDVDMVQTYLPAFEAGIRRGGAKSVMCSYNSVNGIPSCANSFLLQDILRDKWGFGGNDVTDVGYVVSDCGAIIDVAKGHGFRPVPEEAVAASIMAGTDLNCGPYYNKHGVDAVRKKILSEKDVDLALTRLFVARMRLGMFDPFQDQPYTRYPSEVVGHPSHVATALQIGRESLVLLKNKGNALPLAPASIEKLAVLGPHWNSTGDMCSNYFRESARIATPLEGIIDVLGTTKVVSQLGCDFASDDKSGFDAAVNLAKAADAAVLFLGINGRIENEGRDRYDIGLPGVQEEFLGQIASVQSKTILVLINGGSLDISAAADNPNVVAIVEAFYPGLKGSQAIADVLFGKYNPSGRLPYTLYKKDLVDEVSFADMGMTSGPGRTYRFYEGKPVFPFGYGLSYTSFKYTIVGMEAGESVKTGTVAGESGSVQQGKYRVRVQNVGSMSGDVSVLAFVLYHGSGGTNSTMRCDCPKSQLFGFEKIFLDVGETMEVVFGVDVSILNCVRKDDGMLHTPEGWYSVKVGEEEHKIRLSSSGVIVEMESLSTSEATISETK